MKENKHGEIFGIVLKFQDRNKIHEYLEDNLTGHAPKLLKGAPLGLIGAVRNCILSPIFIPVKGNPTAKVVIEIDVRPNTHHCGANIFWVWGKSNSKLHVKNDSKKYYLREGTSTRKINMSDKKEEKYLTKVVESNSGVLESRNLWQLGDIQTEKKIVNIVRGVTDMRSDNHVMGSIVKCLKAWDVSIEKNYASLLGTIINILQKNDQHSKGFLNTNRSDMQSSETDPRKKGGFTMLSNLWKRLTPDEQVEYKKEVDTSGKDTIVYDPTKHGQFKDWPGFKPSQIRKTDGIKAVRVIRPGLSKHDVKPLTDGDLEKVVKEFKKQREKGDEKITVGFLTRLGKKHGFTTGQYQLTLRRLSTSNEHYSVVSLFLQESGWS